MRISSINNVYQNYNNNSFKAAKPKKSAFLKITDKALLPTAITACMLSSLVGCSSTKSLYKPNDVQYQKEFVIDNKNYTMTYVNTDEKFGEKAVSEIYFTCDNKKSLSARLESLTKYISVNGYDVVATVENPKSKETEMLELPQEIGDELLNLYDGKTEFFVIPGVNTYNEIYTNYCK